jgi:hypothetical protein
MKINIHTFLVLLLKVLTILMLINILSCGRSPNVRDRNNELDGDDTKQPLQNQDSVNRELNQNGGGAMDTLPAGLK